MKILMLRKFLGDICNPHWQEQFTETRSPTLLRLLYLLKTTTKGRVRMTKGRATRDGRGGDPHGLIRRIYEDTRGSGMGVTGNAAISYHEQYNDTTDAIAQYCQIARIAYMIA